MLERPMSVSEGTGTYRPPLSARWRPTMIWCLSARNGTIALGNTPYQPNNEIFSRYDDWAREPRES